jgi:hypothetical protein
MQAIQRTAVLEEEELQLKAVQRAAGLEEEEPLQGKLVQRQSEERRAQAATGGLPDDLRAGVEALSGIAMDGVRVHYDSPKPAQLAAHAYAQGSEIHLAPAQEQHLPHEAWHVVQQSQGTGRPDRHDSRRRDQRRPGTRARGGRDGSSGRPAGRGGRGPADAGGGGTAARPAPGGGQSHAGAAAPRPRHRPLTRPPCARASRR